MTTREIEISARGLTAYVEGYLIPEITDDDRRVGHHVLSSYRPPKISEWILQMRGTHRRVNVLEWCISTMVLLGRDADDVTVGVALLLPRDPLEYEVLKKVETFFSKSSPAEIKDGAEANDQYRAIYDLCRRIHYGYIPRVDFLKKWEPIRVAPKAYIGKGYTDKGHLGDSPSWQDQMISADEMTIPDTRSFLGLILSL